MHWAQYNRERYFVLGIFDFVKRTLGIKGSKESEDQNQKNPAHTAQTPGARQGKGNAERPVSSGPPIAGWSGPATSEEEIKPLVIRMMEWVTHPAFEREAFEDREFAQNLQILESHDAHEDLIEILRRASLRLPDHPELLLRLAHIYTERYENNSARTLWQKLIALDHHKAEANFRLGELAERDENPSEAAAYYQRVLIADIDYPNAWQRADALLSHLPMPRKRAAATAGGIEAAQSGSLGLRAPHGYDLQHPLGRGGYGTVYLASDIHLHREVAIKFLHPHLTRDARKVEAFFTEARLVASLGLPGVVRIYDLDEAERVIVMEYLTRGTLRDRLSSGRALAPQAALRVLTSLLGTLHRLHQEGVVHRDLKPENILFRNDGSAVLGDFGVATLEDQSFETRAAGTLAYMAPEQKQPQSDNPIDRRADLYAVGLILVEMLSGGVPARTAMRIHPPEVFLAMLPVKQRELFTRLLGRLLALDPTKRSQNASDVLDEVRALRRQLIAADQAPELVEELERLLKATGSSNQATRDQLEQMRQALQKPASGAMS